MNSNFKWFCPQERTSSAQSAGKILD